MNVDFRSPFCPWMCALHSTMRLPFVAAALREQDERGSRDPHAWEHPVGGPD